MDVPGHNPVGEAEPLPQNAPTQETPTTFRPTSLSVYAQHSGGLWQPANGDNSSVFINAMSTQNNSGNLTLASHHTVSLLAPCETLVNACKNLKTLARQYGVPTHVSENTETGYHFKIVGKHKTRTIWVQEVGHARSLSMISLDDIDGGIDGDWNGDDQIEDSSTPSGHL